MREATEPRIASRSVWHSPLARIRTPTSNGPSGAALTLRLSSGAPTRSRTAALNSMRLLPRALLSAGPSDRANISIIDQGGSMKVYEGGRSLDGAVVTVDGRKLPPRLDLKK